MVKKSKKIKFDLMLVITLVCAVIMVVASFVPFLSYKVTSVIGDNTTNYTGLDMIESLFNEESDLNDQKGFGMFALRLGAFTSILVGSAIIVLAILGLVIGKGGALCLVIAKYLAFASVVLSLFALIGGIIVTTDASFSIGGLASGKMVLGVGLFMYLAGAIGSCATMVMRK